MDMEYYRERQETFNCLREYRHDSVHHLSYMQYLLSTEEYEKLEEYVEQLLDKFE